MNFRVLFERLGMRGRVANGQANSKNIRALWGQLEENPDPAFWAIPPPKNETTPCFMGNVAASGSKRPATAILALGWLRRHSRPCKSWERVVLCWQWSGIIPGVDSLSILLSHRSFQQPAISPGFFGGYLERRIPGKNGEVTPRIIVIFV